MLRSSFTAPSAADIRADVERALTGAGVSSARTEATFLVAGLLGVSTTTLWLGGETVPDTLLHRVHEATRRRAGGEPLAYVLGTADFRELRLAVDPRVLIPRPETEGLVERVLRWAKQRWGGADWGRAVDAGTGSACIALSLATEGRCADVVATETSPGALRVAGVNCVRYASAGTPVRLVRSFLLRALRDDCADMVVSNPPYIARNEMVRLERSVRNYEPRLALESGGDGLDHTRELIRDGLRVVRSGGLLALEVDASRAAWASEMARGHGWANVHVERDLFERPRYLLMTRE